LAKSVLIFNGVAHVKSYKRASSKRFGSLNPASIYLKNYK